MDRLHLKAPGCWINDPNGFIFYRGQYHLFYQCFPYGNEWGRMHWGHAVSSDLVSWEHLPIALFPSKKYDRSGCFSGSAIEHNGKLLLFYTGVNYLHEDPENTNLYLNVPDAFEASQVLISSEDGFLFDNIKDKRKLIKPIEDKNIGSRQHTRDPKVWAEDGCFYMLLGTQVEGFGALMLYRSTDLINWEYLNTTRSPKRGYMWECPDYITIGGQSFLILCVQTPEESMPYYVKAKLDKTTGLFDIEDEFVRLDPGPDMYATQTAVDEEGRTVLIGWMRNSHPEGGGAGMMTIPRVVENRNGKLYMRPHLNIEKNVVNSEDAYKSRILLMDGKSFRTGGVKVSREGETVLFECAGEVYKTGPVKDGYDVMVFAEKGIVEIFINDGEYVFSKSLADPE